MKSIQSYSRMSTYVQCPARYKFKYVDRLTQIVSEQSEFAFGRACHLGFKEYDEHLKASGQKRALRFLKNRIPIWYANTPHVNPGRYDEFRRLMMLFARNHRVSAQNIAACELVLTVDSDGKPCDTESPEAFLIAKIDRLDMFPERNLAVITDYKTARSGSADPFQLFVYAVAVAFHYPEVEAFEMLFDFVRYQYQKSARSARGLTLSLSRKSILQWWDYIKNLAGTIESDPTYPPTVSSGCETCPYLLKCPAKPQIPLQVDNRECAERLGHAILILENNLRRIREIMVRHLEQSEIGFVKVGDVSFSLEAYQHLTADSLPLLVELQKQNVKPGVIDQLLRVDSMGLKEVIRQNKDLAEILSSLVLANGYVKLTHKKDEKKFPDLGVQFSNADGEPKTITPAKIELGNKQVHS